MVMDSSDSPTFTGGNGAAWYLSLLGGLKRRGSWRMPADMRIVTPVGGANLDLDEAELTGERPVLTKVSLVGGVSLRVPPHVDVEVEGFRLFGGVRVAPAERVGPATVTLKVREYSIAGGVQVKRG
jgi:predicted membrane protein